MNKIKSLASYTLSHFCVDFACFYVLFACIYQNFDLQTCGLYFFLYNILAFGLQPIVGYFCDIKITFPAGIFGCLLIVISLLTFQVPFIALLFCGVGNSFFHIGGGIDSLVHSGGKMKRSGVFVSSGALGVTLGTICGLNCISKILPISMLIVCIVLIYIFAEKKSVKTESFDKAKFLPFDFTKSVPFALAILLACFIIVVRCFIGSEIPMLWYDRTVLKLAFIYGFTTMLGKACGGFLGDRFGGRNAGVALLVLCVPFLMLGGENMIISLIGIFLFNTSMPITLCVIYNKLSDNAGLAFGITTLALLIGTIPSAFAIFSFDGGRILLPCLVLISAICLNFICKPEKGNI